MAVVCFASLKGGVGKTSLSIHVARAFAHRSCETLLIDLDPTAHASRYFKHSSIKTSVDKSPLAKLFFARNQEHLDEESEGLLELADSLDLPLVHKVAPGLSMLTASAEYRHFMWGRGARIFKTFFPRLIRELGSVYDQIVIDTPPDFNVLTRNAIATAELVVVPVDPSEMSINSLEEMVACAAHIRGPRWAVIRVMVNKQASRVNKLAEDRLERDLPLVSSSGGDSELIESFHGPDEFIAMLEERELAGNNQTKASDSTEPIYLLDAVIRRTELHNRLTYLGKTAFDTKQAKSLADQYLEAAQEIEQILALGEEEEIPVGFLDEQPRIGV